MTACFARQPFPEGRTTREAIKNGHRLTDGRVERNTKQKELIQEALVQSFIKLNPKTMFRNPVMFLVWIGKI